MAPSYGRLRPWLAAGTLVRLRHQSPAVPRRPARHWDGQGRAQGFSGSSHSSSIRLPMPRCAAPQFVRCNSTPPSSAQRVGGSRSRMWAGRDRFRASDAPLRRVKDCRCLWGPALAKEEGAPGSTGVQPKVDAQATALPSPETETLSTPEFTTERAAHAGNGVHETLESASATSPGLGEGLAGDAERGGNSGASGSRGGTKRVKLKRGQDVELVCDSLAFKGLGVCRVEGTGFVVLCERALPGERLIARISKSKQSFAEAYKLRTLSPHWHAADPPCAHFGSCGGCKLQNLEYHAQLAAKQQQVEDLMLRVGGFGAAEPPGYIKPIIGCAEVYHYRNKMEFSFGARVWTPTQPPNRRAAPGQPRAGPAPSSGSHAGGAPGGEGPIAIGLQTEGSAGTSKEASGSRDQEAGRREGEEASGDAPDTAGAAVSSVPGALGSAADVAKEEGEAEEAQPRGFALGLHAPKRFDKILPIDECHLQDPTANQILAFVRDYCVQRPRDLPAYDPVLHTGFLRHLTIRTGASPETNELQIMVNITTKADNPSLLRPLAEELYQRFPTVVSVLNTVNTSVSDVAPAGGTPHVLQGAATISVPLRGLVFEVSASSFFQTNTAQAEVLYREVEAACALRGDQSEVVLDLFCGTGSIGLSLAPKVKQVYGYEIVPEAVADARRNARRNGITNAEFLEGDLNRVLPTAHQGQPLGGQLSGSAREEEGSEGAAASSVGRPDVIITDPNRPGMHPKLLKHIAEVRAPRIVYVSCNPSTCARDMSVLCHGEDGAETGPYELLSVQPVDMFPHTPHIECVATLVLRQ